MTEKQKTKDYIELCADISQLNSYIENLESHVKWLEKNSQRSTTSVQVIGINNNRTFGSKELTDMLPAMTNALKITLDRNQHQLEELTDELTQILKQRKLPYSKELGF